MYILHQGVCIQHPPLAPKCSVLLMQTADATVLAQVMGFLGYVLCSSLGHYREQTLNQQMEAVSLILK